jgi:hypothetical protein
MMKPEILPEIRRLVNDLVEGRFDLIQADGRAGRVDQEGVERAMRDYPARFIPLPDDVPSLDAYEIEPEPGSFVIDVPLWTTEEGESDLILTVKASPAGNAYRVTIMDLYVH